MDRSSEVCKLGWIGITAFQALTPEGRVLVFDFPETAAVPRGWKEGDEVDILNPPASTAPDATAIGDRIYEVMHKKSGEKFRVRHPDWR